LVTSEQVKEAIKKHKLELPRLQKLYNYYTGRHSILDRKLPDPQKPNNKIVTAYPTLIIDTVVGYFASKPLSYISKSNNQKFLTDLQRVFYLNDEEDINAEIVKNFSIYGKCYELYYIDNAGHIRFNQYSPLEMYVEKDSKNNVLFGVRHWEEKKDDKKITKVEAYDHEGIYYFVSDNGGNFISDPNEKNKEHYFGEVPISIYVNNAEEQGDFEQFIPMIDSIEKMLSDSSNELESWVNAYLVLAGHEGTQSEDLAKMRQDGILLLENIDQAKFLTKEANTEFQQNFFETIDKLIHMHSNTPKLTSEDFSSNLSGVALGFKIFGLETKSMVKERKMEKALRKRVRLIITILNKQGKQYEPFDIRFNFVRNIPQNEAEVADQMTKLVNMVDHETLLSWHPRIQEPAQIVKKVKEQSDAMNLDKISQFQQGNVDG
jgi:SPP1 family phage portal protein